MHSSFSGGRHADYLGIDPSDRYARLPRPIEVCGLYLQPDRTLAARFWQWSWSAPGVPLEVAALLPELCAARAALVDGPQALARPGACLRASERLCATAGKTPDHLPPSGPYAGFIRSSVELFAACAAAGIPLSPAGFLGGLAETYPGAVWKQLSPGLPTKTSAAGRAARKALLERLGVCQLPPRPSHDQLDAGLCALLAAAADDRVAGLRLRAVGQPLSRSADGVWREGPIAVADLSPAQPVLGAEP